MKKNYAHEDSPKVGSKWRSLTEGERIDILANSTNGMSKYECIIPCRAETNGQVFVRLEGDVSASKRGIMLLDYEQQLKDSIDNGIIVWLEPMDDKNYLRKKFRGIQIKS